MMTIGDIKAYIHSVFNFYNRRINMCNTAYLIIEDDISIYNEFDGCYKPPCFVTICIGELLLRLSDQEIRDQIYETVIHELFHADQFMSIYYVHFNDFKFAETIIEEAVELKTAEYIIWHPQELLQFGVSPNVLQQQREIYDNYYRNFNCHIFPWYYRCEYATHLIDLMTRSSYDDDFQEVSNTIFTALEDPHGILKINLNGFESTIKEHDYRMDISKLNMLFINTIYDNEDAYLEMGTRCICKPEIHMYYIFLETRQSIVLVDDIHPMFLKEEN